MSKAGERTDPLSSLRTRSTGCFAKKTIDDQRSFVCTHAFLARIAPGIFAPGRTPGIFDFQLKTKIFEHANENTPAKKIGSNITLLP